MDNKNYELYHHGVLGMKWGVRRSKTGYHSTSIKSAVARRSNDKVDAGFNDWEKNAKKRESAIYLGKKRNVSRMSYENDSSNKQLRNQYRQDNRNYKKALKSNTTWRKGQVKQEVGRDAARKYLSAAKKVKSVDKKQYSKLMNKYDVERSRARRAPQVAANRSRKAASIKRGMTITAKAAATTAAVVGGTAFVNSYLEHHQVTRNGVPFRINKDFINYGAQAIKAGKNFARFF